MAAFATSILKTTPLLMSVNAAAECRARNDRQSYFTISRALAHAQFEQADAELTRRYWQEVADRDLEVGRILHLLFGCSCHDDEEEMLAADTVYLSMGVD